MHTLSTISASVSRRQFDAFALNAAAVLDAEMILSAEGYPAQTISVVGIRPIAELVVEETTQVADIRSFCFNSPGPTLGFVSYDYGLILRDIPSDKPYDFPLGHLKKFAAIAEYNEGTATISSTDASLLRELESMLQTAAPAPPPPVTGAPVRPPRVTLNQHAYEEGVRRTLEYIRSGHTYQLNLSTRFTWDCPGLDPLSLFRAMQVSHPAPFYAWLSSGTHRILSTSPERFIRVRDGEVLSQPIKGTLRFDDYTPELVKELTGSAKESAELSMIVDLIRNDISANCLYGSVRVENHKSVFAVDNLLQMYTDVRGTLRPDRDCLALFFDAFPGGSITGCPKQSSMHIIEELEPHRRGIYCGSIVMIRDERNMDSSIAIRTATFDMEQKKLRTYAGSGIVVDSKPAREYQETMAKAEKFLSLGER